MEFGDGFEIFHFGGLIWENGLEFIKFALINLFLSLCDDKKVFNLLRDYHFSIKVHKLDKMGLSLVLSKFPGVLDGLNGYILFKKMAG